MRVVYATLAAAGALLTCLSPAGAPALLAQPVQTPILGEPVAVTPLHSPAEESAETAQPASATTSAASETAPPTRTASAGLGPDSCEPNDAPERACPLPLDAVSGPFSIAPDHDRDHFLLDIPHEAALQTVITARATPGLELYLSASHATELVASGTYSLTLAPAVAGPIVLRVENRDPRPAADERYRIEVRREIAPPSAAAEAAGGAADALENNWSFETAAPIAVGSVYDLTLVCPEQRPGACPGGDHDYLQVPVKAGVTYLLATFDLDPGIDTVVELFWQDTAQPAGGNDDYGPGGALAALTWAAPADGLALVRIAPRNGGLVPRLSEESRAAYRFAAAPLASELAAKLQATIGRQANLPTPTAAPPGDPAGGGTASGPATAPPPAPRASVTPETITAGPAVIVRETTLRREPREGGDQLAVLAPETPVIVRGQVSGLWVAVEAEASILPGWVRWSDLRRASSPGASAATPEAAGVVPSATASGQPSQQPDVAATTSAGGTNAGLAPTPALAQVTITALDPALPPPVAPRTPRQPFAITVTLVISDRPFIGGPSFGMATPTPDMRRPVSGVRLQLANAFGDVLAEGITDSAGSVRFARDVRTQEALHIRVPAWGAALPVAHDQGLLVITVPEAQQ